jgi:predicted transcriptional regulator of viral defense system
MVALTDIGLPSVFTHADARASGLSDRSLYSMRDKGHIELIARGIYSKPGIIADHDLIEIAIRAPKAILCLTTALARHNLVDDIPPTIDVALPRRQRSPRTKAPATWHRFDEDTFDIGREEIAVYDDLTIGIYSPTRSIIDAFRLRHFYGQDQAIEALKTWLKRPGSQPSDLLTMAKHFPTTQSAIRGILEILL